MGHNPGCNTLRRHVYVMGLNNNPTYNKCGMEEETSVHILCESEALASFRCAYLGSFFLDPEDIMDLSILAVMGHKGPYLRPRCIGPRRAQTQLLF
jgi:hypothetical protein